MRAQGLLALDEQIALAERCLDDRELRPALTAFDLAEEMGADPDGCSAARWMASMLSGDFEAAWEESDAIGLRGGADLHRFWRGEDLRGKRVILRCLHGFGDAIQFLRYLPALRSLAQEVIVELPPRMVELAPLLDGVGQVTTWGDAAPTKAPAWDVQIEIMELPYLFRTCLADLPIAAEYLRVPPADVARAAKIMGTSSADARVGLVWAAGEWNQERSIPVESLDHLLRISGAEFWSLQGGKAASGVQNWVYTGTIRDAAIVGQGQRALAAAISNLDLVITVDTLAAHMAGAMGKPVWLLLQHAADWRWMTDRCDTPWYPKTRLFRQPQRGNWNGVVDHVGADLVHLLKDACGIENAPQRRCAE